MLPSTPAFIFDAKFERQAVALAHEWPYIHPAMRERLKERLALGCYCKHDKSRTATLTRRSVAGAVSIWLQCDACGSAIGSAMAREAHPRWQDYRQWDSALQDIYEAARQAFWDERKSPIPTREEAAAEFAQRRREYLEWCRTSPEWHAIRDRILWRSRGHCEGCLQRPATFVHHLTYEFGKLPPAWHLKAVCDLCHERLHDGDDEWCAFGMARVSSDVE